jgi:hypothetical protein
MREVPTKWMDSSLPNGREFSIAICGESGRIRYMTLGKDNLFHKNMTYVLINDTPNGTRCEAGDICLDLACPLNRTSREKMANVFGMAQDETLDGDIANIWQTDSALDSFSKLIEQLNKAIQLEEQVKAQAKETKKKRKSK